MLRDAIARWDAEMGLADDAPLWAEVAAVVFAAGLFWRTGMHTITAVFTPWVCPELSGNDVTWRSPVDDLRGRRVVAVAHLLCALSAFVGASLWPPAKVAVFSPTLALWASLQLLVLACDPLAFVAARVSGRAPWRDDDPGLRASIERLNERLLSN